MGDSYNEKPARNVRTSDVVGIIGFAGVALIVLYLVALLVYHLIAGRVPG